MGGSSIVDPNGVAVAVSPVVEPHLLVADIDFDLITIARSSSPLLADLENGWADIQRLVKHEPHLIGARERPLKLRECALQLLKNFCDPFKLLASFY